MPPKRRRKRSPAFELDDLDFEWILLPWDFLVGLVPGLWSSLTAGAKAAWAAWRTRRAIQIFTALFVFAALARLWHPDWYSANNFHPDERWIFDKAAELSYPGEPGKNDPAGMQYGSLPFYAVATVKDLLSFRGFNFASGGGLIVHGGDAYHTVMVWGRGLTGCVDTLTVLAVFLLAWQLAGAVPALLAALVIACAPLHIQLAHFFTVDPWLACFATFTLAACVRAARRPSLGVSALIGVLYAAALASKSSGLPLVIPISLSLLWPALEPGLIPAERGARLRAAGMRLAVAAGATLAAFFVLMPWAFLDFNKFVQNQTAQREMLVTGSPGGTPFVRQYWDTSVLFHPRNIVLFYLGLPAGFLALLAIPGMGAVAVLRAWRAWSQAAMKPKTRKPAQGGGSQDWALALGPLLLLTWLIPYFSIVGFSFAKFARYMLPALPALAVLLALGVDWLMARARFAALSLAALTAFFSLGYGSGYFLTYFHAHPWLETSRWTYANIPPYVPDPSAPGGRRATRILNEDWGDDLPVPVDGQSGSYNNLKDQMGQVNIVEWDSANKLDRMCTSLSQTDVIFLADPRGYGTYLRIPHRFPLTYTYYHLLFSDPARLGFELAHESSNPIRLFGILPVSDSRIPSVPAWLWADESFTLYDRPHAYVFRRSSPKTPEEIRQILLDQVAADKLSTGFLTNQAPDEMQQAYENSLSGAPAASLQPQQGIPLSALNVLPEGGINRNFGMSRGVMVPLGAAVPWLTWWFLVSALGWLALPLTARLFSGFPAGGYALSRALGVFLFGWAAYNLAWLFPKLTPFTQSTLWLIIAAVALGTAFKLRGRGAALAAWIREQKAEILFTEAVFAATFLYFVLVRSFIPNIHDVVGQGYFGGGEPLGMTYLSAVTRCASFPAYDPWLALANSSYYYFGYVLAAALTKLSGFPPSITYNLSLALFFSLSFVSAFGLLRALVSRRRLALAGAAMVALAGSLWSVSYIALRIVRSVGVWDGLFSGGLFSHGFIWDPTRFPELVSGHIFEFPYFSYLYGDLHPHNMVIPFSIVLAALFLKPFLRAQAGWRSLGDSDAAAWLWIGVVALLLDAQYAINTWSWPIFVGLGAASLYIGPWAKGPGRKVPDVLAWCLAFGAIAIGAAALAHVQVLAGTPTWAGVLLLLAGLAGLPLALIFCGGRASLMDFLKSTLALVVILAAGRLLMFGFRHYYLQNGANRAGNVLPAEWQMSTYIPLAYYLPGLLALAALGGVRLNAWALSLAKPLGAAKLKRKDWMDTSLTLGERYLGRFPGSAASILLFAAVVLGLLFWATVNWKTQGVWAVSLALGLASIGFFLLGGHERGKEAFLWMLGGCFCLMVAGVEFKYVADRGNTIFKVWMNGWIFSGLVFGAGFASAFESSPAAALGPSPARRVLPARRASRSSRTSRVSRRNAPVRRVSPQAVFTLAGGLGLALVVIVAAYLDARDVGNSHFLLSYLGFGFLLLAVTAAGALYAGTAWFTYVKRGLFCGLLALGLLYPLGATVAKIREAGEGSIPVPHLDGMSFMAQRAARSDFADRDYDAHDYVLIRWLNDNADVTETVVEAPGMELYKGFSRFSIYTGLPTLLGWDFQVGQQLGERTGLQLENRKRDASVIYGPDDAAAVAMLKHYRARWIVVGSLERKIYPPEGLDKFQHLASVAVQDGASVLYRFDWDKP